MAQKELLLKSAVQAAKDAYDAAVAKLGVGAALDPADDSAATSGLAISKYVAQHIRSRVNLFNKENVTADTFARTDGTTQSSTGYSMTSYMPVEEGSNYTYDEGQPVQWFDSSLAFLSGEDPAANPATVTAPAGAAFVRTSFFNDQGAQFVQGDSLPDEFIPYDEAIALHMLPRAIRPDVKNLSLELSDRREIEDFGGEIIAGTLGVDAEIKVPFYYSEHMVIELEFQMPFDLHSGQGEKVLLSLNEDDATTPVEVLSGINSVAPTTSPYVPDYPSNAFQEVRGSKFSGAAFPEKLDGYFNGRDAFSVRKISPVSADTDIVLEVTSTFVRIYDGAGDIGKWLFSGFATMDALIDQMVTDLGADYDVIRHYSAGKVPADLAMFSANIVKSQEEWDLVTDASTGTTIYDSYPTYVPTKDLTTWHTFQLEIAPRPLGNHYVRTYLDGHNAYENFFSGMDQSGNFHLYLNHDPSGTYAAMGAPIRNLKVYRKERPRNPRYICLMNHAMIENPETDGQIPPSGNNLTMTSGRLKRVVSRAKELGWEFIPLRELVGMIQGDITRRDKVMAFTIDDNKFDFHDVEAIRKVIDSSNIKYTSCIITDTFDFVANSDKLSMLERDEHEFCHHAHRHNHYENYSYSQFISEIGNSITAFEAANRKSTFLVYSYGSVSDAQQKWYRNNGFSIGFITSDSPSHFNGSKFKSTRVSFDDAVSFSEIEQKLNI